MRRVLPLETCGFPSLIQQYQGLASTLWLACFSCFSSCSQIYLHVHTEVVSRCSLIPISIFSTWDNQPAELTRRAILRGPALFEAECILSMVPAVTL